MPDMDQYGMGRVKHIHFVGIGGAGMSGIAEVLASLGYEISGSDMNENRVTRTLKEQGINISIGHSAENIQSCDVVVKSTAIKDDNIELVAARDKHIPIVRRAVMLAELMRFSKGIAVAGTHGKTTTTSLVASLLQEGGLDPTYVIGGLLKSSGSNANLGTGKYFVAEADESDASFLHLYPVITILTNIDEDHLETYQGDFRLMQQHFVDFIHQLPFYGIAVVCLDDAGTQEIYDELSRPLITYALDTEADYMAEIIETKQDMVSFKVSRKDIKDWLHIEMHLPGEHNVKNALAAIAVAHELGVEDKALIAGLKKFAGIDRRFEIKGDIQVNNKNIFLIDDYAHHPTEIEATLSAIRQGWQERRLVVVYQPHRFTRTRDLFEDFSHVLSQADVLVMLKVYPAGESLIAGADSRSLCRSIRQRGKVEPVFIEEHEQLQALLEDILEDGDVLLTLGAGDIGKLSNAIQTQYSHTVH